MQIVKRLLSGDRLALARLISAIEDRTEGFEKAVAELFPHGGKAFIVGITGPPGAGKSTITDRLIQQFRKEKKTVAVVAVDPSSPFSGGAILGDRIRMQSHISDSGVYIRSLGTRGQHGGLSYSSKEVVLALDAAGFEVVIVETAGVGQTELEILKVAHCVCVVLVPESGDGIQMMKAGLMEISDIFVVNKIDRPEADRFANELIQSLENVKKTDEWEVPVIKTQATKNQGTEELCTTIRAYQKYLQGSARFREKLQSALVAELEDIAQSIVREQLEKALKTDLGISLLNQLLGREIDPREALKKLLPNT